MNEKEKLKKAVIESCINGTMTIKVAANRLDFSERYIKKLKARYKKIGASSIIHGNCGKQPKHTISAVSESTTQYGRMMKYLGVDLIHAGSSQAKGRIERLWNTLHDRLRTEFRRLNITTIDGANKFLDTN